MGNSLVFCFLLFFFEYPQMKTISPLFPLAELQFGIAKNWFTWNAFAIIDGWLFNETINKLLHNNQICVQWRVFQSIRCWGSYPPPAMFNRVHVWIVRCWNGFISYRCLFSLSSVFDSCVAHFGSCCIRLYGDGVDCFFSLSVVPSWLGFVFQFLFISCLIDVLCDKHTSLHPCPYTHRNGSIARMRTMLFRCCCCCCCYFLA